MKRRGTRKALTVTITTVASMIAGLLVGVATPAPAAGPSATWGNKNLLADIGEEARMGLSDDGSKAVAMWGALLDEDGPNERQVLFARVGSISGTSASWGATAAVSVDATGEEADLSRADLAVSANAETVVATWTGRSGGSGNRTPYTRVGKVTGSTIDWGDITPLAASTPQRGMTAVEISADGAKVTYLWRQTNVIRVRSATISGNSADLGTTTDFTSVPDGYGDSNLELALSRNGEKAAAIFESQDGSSDPSMEVISGAISGNTGTWSAAQTISTGKAGGTYVDIKMSDDGSLITALWKQLSMCVDPDDPGELTECEYPLSASATWGTPASWGSVTALVGDMIAVDVVALGLSANGLTALAIYEDQTYPHHLGILVGRSAVISGNTQSWGAESGPLGSNDVDEMDATLSADGKVGIAVWEGEPGTGDSLNSAPIAVNGSSHTWGTPTTLTEDTASEGGYYPVVGLSRGGCRATTVWGWEEDEAEEIVSDVASKSAVLTCASPSVTSVSPPKGPVSGGTRITIKGDGFYPGARVHVGGKECQEVQVVSPTEITCYTPAGTVGPVDVVVTNDDAQASTLAKAFTYYESTPLVVTGRAKNKPLPLRKKTQLVKKIQTDGKKTIKVQCRVKGKLVAGSLGKRVCGTTVKKAKGKVWASPKCTATVTVVIRAKETGVPTSIWRRTWKTKSTSSRGDLAWLPANCLR